MGSTHVFGGVVYSVFVKVTETEAIFVTQQMKSKSSVEIVRRSKGEAYAAAIGHLLALGGPELEAYLKDQAELFRMAREVFRSIQDKKEDSSLTCPPGTHEAPGAPS